MDGEAWWGTVHGVTESDRHDLAIKQEKITAKVVLSIFRIHYLTNFMDLSSYHRLLEF